MESTASSTPTTGEWALGTGARRQILTLHYARLGPTTTRYWSQRCLNALVSPEGTYDLASLFGSCPSPADPVLDDNVLLTWVKSPTRVALAKLLQQEGMHEQAIAHIQDTP